MIHVTNEAINVKLKVCFGNLMHNVGSHKYIYVITKYTLAQDIILYLEYVMGFKLWAYQLIYLGFASE